MSVRANMLVWQDDGGIASYPVRPFLVLPVFLSMTTPVSGQSCHAHGPSMQAVAGGTATLVHGAGYLGMTALAAWIVVDRSGLAILRKGWINLDVIWSAALIVTGCLTLFV